MSPRAVCSVSDIDPATQALLERLFGQHLRADQKVLLTLLDVDGEDSQGRAAWATINRILDKAAGDLKEVPEVDFDAALDEAMEHVRHRTQP